MIDTCLNSWAPRVSSIIFDERRNGDRNTIDFFRLFLLFLFLLLLRVWLIASEICLDLHDKLDFEHLIEREALLEGAERQPRK